MGRFSSCCACKECILLHGAHVGDAWQGPSVEPWWNSGEVGGWEVPGSSHNVRQFEHKNISLALGHYMTHYIPPYTGNVQQNVWYRPDFIFFLYGISILFSADLKGLGVVLQQFPWICHLFHSCPCTVQQNITTQHTVISTAHYGCDDWCLYFHTSLP